MFHSMGLSVCQFTLSIKLFTRRRRLVKCIPVVVCVFSFPALFRIVLCLRRGLLLGVLQDVSRCTVMLGTRRLLFRCAGHFVARCLRVDAASLSCTVFLLAFLRDMLTCEVIGIPVHRSRGTGLSGPRTRDLCFSPRAVPAFIGIAMFDFRHPQQCSQCGLHTAAV